MSKSDISWLKAFAIAALGITGPLAILGLIPFWRLVLCVSISTALALVVQTGLPTWVVILPGFVLGAVWELTRRKALKGTASEQE